MKTQIVQLEPHDDYISVRDRMGWGQTTRVLLVWPLRGGILHRRLDLTLIKRHSTALGSQLALVTRDREVRYQADRLAIPVYKSVRDAEQSRWRRPRKRWKKTKDTSRTNPKVRVREKLDLEAMRDHAHPAPPRWLMHPMVRISIFTIGVLSMLVVTSIFIPSAEVRIRPASKAETITIDVSASPDHQAVDISGAVPVYLESIIVEGRGRTLATGETSIPRQSATGNVTFVNLTDGEINVPVDTIVSTRDTPPIRFATTREQMIPTGPDGATVPIEAIQPGSLGNVPAEVIVAIEGPLGLNLSTTNRRRTDGGSDYTALTANEDDYLKVFDQLINELEKAAQSQFELNASPNDVFLSTNSSSQKILEESYYPEPGEPSDYLELSLRVEFLFPYASEDDLFQLGRIVMDRHTSKSFSPRPDTLQITPKSKPDNQLSDKASWSMQASWQMGANLNNTDLIATILGQKPEEALQKLNQNPSIESSTEIRITPDWWPRLPLLPFRINIINLLDTDLQDQ